MDYKKSVTITNICTAINLLAAIAVCMVFCHGPIASAAVFENGQYWIGGYRADPLNVEPTIESGTLEIDANTWTNTGQSTSEGSYTSIITVDSITPLANGYYRVEGTENGGNIFDTTVAATASLYCESTHVYDGSDRLGMTLVLPKADNPLTEDFDGVWKQISFRTGMDVNGRYAEAQTAQITLSSATATGSHQAPDGTIDTFTWTEDSAASTVTVTLDSAPVSFDIGIAEGGLMFRAGLEVGETDPNELCMDLFVQVECGRDEQEAVGRYALQTLMANEELSLWDTLNGILSIEADGSYTIDFEPDAMGYEDEGWSEAGTWSMTSEGCITFQNDEDGGTVAGYLTPSGKAIVGADPQDGPQENCSLVVATQIVPEPAISLLLLSAVTLLLFVRHR